MTDPVTLLAILAALGVAGISAAGLSRAAARGKASRRDVLADCRGVLDGAAIEVDDAGYGILRGRYQGVEVALRPFSEALAFRRLPQLWLAATVRLPNGGEAMIDALRRPTGAEFYAPGASLPVGFAPPKDWPQDTSVRGTRGAAPLLAAIGPALGALLADPKIKDAVVSPKGARIVRQLAQGARGAYLIYRESRFENARANPEDVRAALDAALMLARAARDAALPSSETHESERHAAA